MATATLLSLRDRMTPPAGSRPGAPRASAAARSGPAPRRPEIDRVLTLATDLFGVAAAALVLAGPDGLEVEAVSGGGDEGAVAAALRLFEVLAGAEPAGSGRHAGVMEEVAPGRGFVAATPILSAAGRCLGAVVLLDGARRVLLTGLQRRLFAEFGDLLVPALGGAPASSPDPAAQLQALADADPDAFAVVPAAQRPLDALGAPQRPADGGHGLDLAGARGCEARWIAFASRGTWRPSARTAPAQRRGASRADAAASSPAWRRATPSGATRDGAPLALSLPDVRVRRGCWPSTWRSTVGTRRLPRARLDGAGRSGPGRRAPGRAPHARRPRAAVSRLAHRGRPAVLVTVESAPGERASGPFRRCGPR